MRVSQTPRENATKIGSRGSGCPFLAVPKVRPCVQSFSRLSLRYWRSARSRPKIRRPPNADERRKRIAASLRYGRREESHGWLPLVATTHRAPAHLPSSSEGRHCLDEALGCRFSSLRDQVKETSKRASGKRPTEPEAYGTRDERWGAVAVKDRDDPTTTHSTRSPTFATHSTLSPTEPHLEHILSVRRSHAPGVAAMKKPGLTGLKLGIDFGAYVVDLVFRRGCAFLRQRFRAAS